MLTDTNVENIV